MTYSTTLLQSSDTLTLKEIWQKIEVNSCPYAYNFHLHTTCSDGQLTPENLIKQAIKNGLKEIAITDHHSIKGYDQAKKILIQEQAKYPYFNFPRLWKGIEITSDLLGTNVHLLAYNFDQKNPNLQVYFKGIEPEGIDKNAQIVIERFHQAGGLVILAHPCRYRRSAKDLIPLAVTIKIDGVEAYYAYDNPQPWQTSLKQTQQVIAIANQYNLLLTCGTDTHGLNILHRV